MRLKECKRTDLLIKKANIKYKVPLRANIYGDFSNVTCIETSSFGGSRLSLRVSRWD